MNALETKVLELIGESTSNPDVFLDTDEGLAPIRDSLNDAIQEVAMVTGSRRVDYFLPLRERQAFYRFAPQNGSIGWVTDAWSINRKYRLEQTSLLKLAAYDIQWMVTQGEPRSYFQLGTDIIGFWPKPGGDTNTLKLTVVEIPAPYKTSLERLKVRDDFNYAVVNYAVAEYWASRGDDVQATNYINYYLDAMGLREKLTGADRTPSLQTVKEPWPRETA